VATIFSKLITVGIRTKNSEVFTFPDLTQFLRSGQLLRVYILRVSRFSGNINARPPAKKHAFKLSVHNYESGNFWRGESSGRTRQTTSREGHYKIVGRRFPAVEKVDRNADHFGVACIIDHFGELVVRTTTRIHISPQIFNGIFMSKRIGLNGLSDLLFRLTRIVRSSSEGSYGGERSYPLPEDLPEPIGLFLGTMLVRCGFYVVNQSWIIAESGRLTCATIWFFLLSA
jgi:hypothetical protein